LKLEDKCHLYSSKKHTKKFLESAASNLYVVSGAVRYI